MNETRTLDGLAHLARCQQVSARRGTLDLGIVSQPLVGVGDVVQPIGVGRCPEVSAVSVWPTSAVPLMVGVPVAAEFGLDATVAVAVLASSSAYGHHRR